MMIKAVEIGVTVLLDPDDFANKEIRAHFDIEGGFEFLAQSQGRSAMAAWLRKVADDLEAPTSPEGATDE